MLIKATPGGGRSALRSVRTARSLSLGADCKYFSLKNIYMEYAIIAAILGAIGLIGNYFSNKESRRAQEQHDLNMAEVNKQNQMALMRYETELQQQNNTIATQTGHAAQAGVNPALLYGSMSTPGLYDPSPGGSSGSASSLPELRLFDRLPTNNIVETMFTKRKQDMDMAHLQSQIAEEHQRTLESAARTAEQTRNTSFQKSIEKLIFDQQTANLHLLQSQGENLDFMTNRAKTMLPLELEKAHLINSETAANINRINSEITKNSWEISEIRKNMTRIDKMNELTDEEKKNVIESTKKSALGRIMQEFGLTRNMLGANFKLGQNLRELLQQDRMKGAMVQLVSLGFSEEEAAGAVLYYVANDPKDVTPSVLNSASRFLSAMILKK